MPLHSLQPSSLCHLLRLYPVALRRHFGEEMMEVFTDQIRDALRSARQTQWGLVPLVFDESDEPLIRAVQLNGE